MHDHHGAADIWMIDFGKTTELEPGKTLTHRTPWVEGNREDGYLIGVDNMIALFEEMLSECESGSSCSSKADATT